MSARTREINYTKIASRRKTLMVFGCWYDRTLHQPKIYPKKETHILESEATSKRAQLQVYMAQQWSNLCMKRQKLRENIDQN